MRAAIGNSNEVTPSGLVIRQTAVPDFVSAPNFSHTNKYFPPPEACVRSTSKLARLHSTFVASSPRPEISNITSGVNPIHQFGGSTCVTTGETSAFDVCEASASKSASPQKPGRESKQASTRQAIRR